MDVGVSIYKQFCFMIDRISSLPDSLLLRILCFVPIKDAILTNILSNRWRALWRSIPSLKFDQESYFPYGLYTSETDIDKNYLRFVQFVDAVLILRGDEPITKFCLLCPYYVHPSSLHVWVNAAIQRRVQILQLILDRMSSKPIISLPFKFFTTTTLVVLELHFLTFKPLPSSVFLPSLKVMRLRWVKFEDSDCVGKFLSGCPNLEKISHFAHEDIDLSSWGNSIRPKLVIAIVPTLRLPLEALPNAQLLRISPNGYPTSSHAPIFHNLIDLMLDLIIEYNWDFIMSLIHHSPKLQVLVIEKDLENDIMVERQNWCNPTNIPGCFPSHLRECKLIGFRGLNSEVQFARYIMKNAMVLRSMTIWPLKPHKMPRITKILCSSPRSSPTCELLFESQGSKSCFWW